MASRIRHIEAPRFFIFQINVFAIPSDLRLPSVIFSACLRHFSIPILKTSCTLFKACNRFTPRPLNYFPLKQRWKTKANLTLLGDAAHLMPPNSEGVNLAMLDALNLSDFLTNAKFRNLEHAMPIMRNE